MKRDGDLEYALARIGARMGDRPREASWRALAVIRDFAAFIDAARAGPLARWMKGIGRHADAHVIEEELRENALCLVHEVRDWMPLGWQPAVDWSTVLLDIPAALYLARGDSPLSWMRQDATSRKLAREPWLVHGDAARAMQAWREGWLRCAPHDAANDTLLRDLGHRLATEPRRSLGPPLQRLYRRATLRPAAAFVFLALSALDMERLRGELLRRALFPLRAAE
jgi:hypothetical protein